MPRRVKAIIFQLILTFIILVGLSKVALAYGDFELRRLGLPGFWHVVRGHPFVLNEEQGDISVAPVSIKVKAIWQFIKKQDP